MSHVPLPQDVIYAPDYPLETARLRLRPFNRGDVDAVYAYRSLPDVAEYLFDQPMTREECAEVVRSRTGQVAFMGEGDKILLAVERKEDGTLIGEVSLIWRHVADRQAEIGYILNPAFQRLGYATEAARSLIAFGFEQAEQHRIYARCDALNVASWRLMERLGMRREAHFREHARFKGALGRRIHLRDPRRRVARTGMMPQFRHFPQFWVRCPQIAGTVR